MRWVLYGLGWVFAALALAGLVLPLLPCTPFALLSATCFGHSSPAAKRWLYESRWLGPVLSDWRCHRGFRRATKFRLIALASVASLLTIVVSPSLTTVAVSLLMTAAALVAIAVFPTVRPTADSEKPA